MSKKSKISSKKKLSVKEYKKAKKILKTGTIVKYGFQLEIINNETKEHLSKDLMSDDMQVVIKELQSIIDELKFLYKTP